MWMWEQGDVAALRRLQVAFRLPEDDRTLPSDDDIAELCHDRHRRSFALPRCARVREEARVRDQREKEEQRRWDAARWRRRHQASR